MNRSISFRNPILLAAGTCGFGFEVSGVVDLERLGGFVTKSVTPEPRSGNPAPRVTEFPAGMLNSIGLANPGVERVADELMPRIAAELAPLTQVIVSVAGHTLEDYFQVVERLDPFPGFVAFELNLSCPNDAKRGGLPFALDRDALPAVLKGCRERTERPLFAKLAPNDPDLATTTRLAVDSGADALTLVNTLPGRVLNSKGSPILGAKQGGVSGPALRAVGVQAVAVARAATDVPIAGVGGVLHPRDAQQYLNAGASLVQMGTASFAAPRAAQKVAAGLARLGCGGPVELSFSRGDA